MEDIHLPSAYPCYLFPTASLENEDEDIPPSKVVYCVYLEYL